MKLKKIASLALAGVMAVSMLAGCATKGEDNTQNNDQNEVVPAATVADYANSLLSTAQKNVFEFKNSSELTAALQKVASDSEKFTSDEIIALKGVYDYAHSNPTSISDLAAALKDELKADFDNSTYTGLGTVTAAGTRTITFAYAVSANLEEEAAVQVVINGWKGNMAKTMFPATVPSYGQPTWSDYHPAYDCDYSAEISAVKVTAPDDATASVWVVAFTVTQTATEAPNV